MTPASGVFPFFTILSCLMVVAGVGSSGRLASSSAPKLEIVAGNDPTFSSIVPELDKRGTANVEYLRYTPQSYSVLATIGPYSFLLSLDTASADTWVVSSACRTASCRGLPAFSASIASPSFSPIADNNTIFHVAFADGTSADGFVARENLGVGGFMLNGQPFGLVNDTNVTLASGDTKSSGVLGLGFPRLSSISRTVPNSAPVIARLAQQGELSYPLFGLSLRKNNTGTLSLGAIDAGVVSNLSSIAWHDVAPFPTLPSDNSSVYLQWAIHLSAISVGGDRIQLNSTFPEIVGSQPLALLDLGTNGMFGPASDVVKVFSLIPSSRLVGDGQYAVPCETTANMSLIFGTRSYVLQPRDYIFARVEDPPNMCLAWPRAMAPSNDGLDWQLGTPFLRTVYSVFSYGINHKEPPKIGLYPLALAVDTPEVISTGLSSDPAVFPTTLPNFVLPTPTYTTPPYIFSPSSLLAVSVSAVSSAPGSSRSRTSSWAYSVPTLGQLQDNGLGASTYSPLVTRSSGALLPTDHVSFTVLTDSSGIQSTQLMPMQTAVLGGPEISRGQMLGVGVELWSIFSLLVVFSVS
ncbi:aspartyl protease [Ceratobasidium sp. AG-Ba]|nr:aspartyl protease [Ceratobasidium sp. AG-Ba]